MFCGEYLVYIECGGDIILCMLVICPSHDPKSNLDKLCPQTLEIADSMARTIPVKLYFKHILVVKMLEYII